MAFFDSPKNRAMWGRELISLEEERKKRAANGYKPQQAAKTKAGSAFGKSKDRPLVRRITLAELIAIENAARKAAVSAEQMGANEMGERKIMRRNVHGGRSSSQAALE